MTYDELKAERDSLASERDDLLMTVQAEREGAIRYYRDREALLMASGKNYWLWQGDGDDHLESLVCPVLIQAKQLQAIVAERDSLAEQLRRAREALKDANFALYRAIFPDTDGADYRRCVGARTKVLAALSPSAPAKCEHEYADRILINDPPVCIKCGKPSAPEKCEECGR